MSDLSNIAEQGVALSVEMNNGDNKTVVACPNYFGNGEFWWFGSAAHHRPTTWDRDSSLSVQMQPFEQLFSYGRKRLMALIGQNVNPKIRFMSCYDEINLLVSKPGKLIWDSQTSNNVDELFEAVSNGVSLRVAFSENGLHWYSSRVDTVQVSQQKQEFCIQNEIAHWPVLALQPDDKQEQQISDIFNHLTQNKTLQIEDPRCKSQMLEFKMDYVDMWRAIFESGVMFSAYSTKEGVSFRYNQVKVFIEPSELAQKVAI